MLTRETRRLPATFRSNTVCILEQRDTGVAGGAAARMFEVITMETNCCFAVIKVSLRLALFH